LFLQVCRYSTETAELMEPLSVASGKAQTIYCAR